MTRPTSLRPVVRRLSDGRILELDELAAITAPANTATVTGSRCGESRPKAPRLRAWFTFRWGRPACAAWADLPDRPGAA